MRVYLTLDFRNDPARRRPWREFWEDGLWLLCEAEAMGFDGVLVQEHFFQPDGYGPSITAFLTLLAERTRRVRIGSYLHILPLHHPARLAQECAVLDHLSEGRLDVTVGLGHSLAEYRAFGVDPRRRPSRMEEGLQLLRLAWTEHPFSFRGAHYAVDNLEVRPEPLQQPHPPLWVGVTSAAAAERAGRHGTHLAAASTEPEVYRAYRDGLASGGHDPAAARVSGTLTLTATREDPERVWQRNRRLYFDRWDFYRRIREELGDPALAVAASRNGETSREAAPSPETYRGNELIGEPAVLLAALEPLARDLGWTDFVLNGPASGIDWRGEGHASVKLFAEQVLPVLKGWTP